MWLIVGITGVTGGGKTTLSTALVEHFTKLVNENGHSNRRINSVHVLHQDNYFHKRDSPKHIRIKEINYPNREVMTALDMDLMWQDIMNIRQIVGDRNAGVDILFIEGFLIFNYKPIDELCDMRFFIELPGDVCLARRLKRTFKHINPNPEYYFQNFIWPEYQKYRDGMKLRSNEIVFLNGVDDPSATFTQVRDLITRKISNSL